VNRFESVANRLAAWYFPDHLVLHISGAVSPTSLSLGRSLCAIVLEGQQWQRFQECSVAQSVIVVGSFT
jgi:hypothetical protein